VGRGGAAKGRALPLPNSFNQQILSVAGAPAPHQMAVRRYTGEAMEKTLAWTANEVERFMRN
jgi:hypothetical protein